MKDFFIKYSNQYAPLDAIRLIHTVLHKAKDKAKEEDATYLNDMALLTQMCIDYFIANGMDYKSYLKTV